VRKYFLITLLLLFTVLSANIQILESTPTRLIVEIDLDNYSIQQEMDYTTVQFSDWLDSGIAGAPSLPIKVLNIAIPPDGKISAKIISQEIKKESLEKPIIPTLKIIDQGEMCDFIYERDEELYSKRDEHFFELLPEMRYRYYQIVPVEISPFLYDAMKNEMTISEKMVLEIKISGDVFFRNTIPDKFEKIYKNFIFNYDTAKFWMTEEKNEIPYFHFNESDFWFRFESPQKGLHELSFQQLSQIPTFCEPDSIRIFTTIRDIIDDKTGNYQLRIVELPTLIEAGDDGNFDSGDYVYFLDEFFDDIRLKSYSKQRKYWLTFGGQYHNKPVRIEEGINRNSAFSVSGFSRKFPKDLTIREDEIECLIISHHDFLSHSDSLANIHFRNFGVISEVVDQQDIFDQYGIEDPVVIKNFIQFRFESATGYNLQQVILMGSGTNEWENSTNKNKVMVYEIDGSTMDDNFVTFSGNLPELSIGRLPAQNTSDMDLLIERTRKYIEEPTLGWWKNEILIVADDEHKRGGLEGIGGSGMNHTLKAQLTADMIKDSIYVDKVLGIEYEFDEYQNKPDARNDMIDKVNAGKLVWYFIGHGNEDVLGDEGYFKGSLHIRLLDNVETLPLFIAASCEVGCFDDVNYDCMAEKLLFAPNGGSISSIAATSGSSPDPNALLMQRLLVNMILDKENQGMSLLDAKLNSSYWHIYNNKLYNLLGDPLLPIVPSERVGNIYNVPDSVQARQTVSIAGNIGNVNQNGVGEIRVYDSEYWLHYENYLPQDPDHVYSVDYTRNGNAFFKGMVGLSNGSYESTFIVPDDIRGGEEGRIIMYFQNELEKESFLTFYHPMKLSKIPVDSISTDEPSVQIWIDSKKFETGDYVSTDPLFIAAISDSNGINISGSPGRRMLLLLDHSEDPDDLIDVTSGFVYDLNSHTQGELTWQLSNISEGKHEIQLVVFDNFGVSTIAETDFMATKSDKVAIKDMLPYPNPMQDDGYFTFVITEPADITITIYTITGRKIRTLKQPNCEVNFNKIYWNGRDEDGDKIANGTYFYKLKAKHLQNKKITEKIGKVIILK